MSSMKLEIDIYIDTHGDPQLGQVTQITGNPKKDHQPETVLENGSIHLDPTAPDFKKRKSELKEKGYQYDKSNQSWYLPSTNGTQQSDSSEDFSDWFGDVDEIPLSKDEPNFEQKKDALKAAGFNWINPRKLWVRPSEPKA